jgi:hypothetical protein
LIAKTAQKHVEKKCGFISLPSILRKNHEYLLNNNWKILSLNTFYEKNSLQLQNKLTVKLVQQSEKNDQISSEIANSQSKSKSKSNSSYSYSQSQTQLRREVEILSQRLEFNLFEIYSYFRYLHKEKKRTEIGMKFSEESWKAVTMGVITIYSVFVLFSDFFYDPSMLYASWPQKDTWDVFLYYQISLGYHGHRALYQFVNVKRKDFWALFAHHWVTLFLICTSFAMGIMQSGCLVMFIHDNSDFLLSTAKLFKYSGMNRESNITFGLFCASWVVCRIYLLSKKVIYTMMFDARGTYDCHFLYPVFLSLLFVLLFLHIYWLRLIAGVAMDAITKSKTVTDTRSDSESDDIPNECLKN